MRCGVVYVVAAVVLLGRLGTKCPPKVCDLPNCECVDRRVLIGCLYMRGGGWTSISYVHNKTDEVNRSEGRGLAWEGREDVHGRGWGHALPKIPGTRLDVCIYKVGGYVFYAPKR